MPPPVSRLSLAVVGLGPWGTNLVRAFGSVPSVRVAALCDTDLRRLGAAQCIGKPRRLTSLRDVLRDPTIHAVAIATPSDRHYEHARLSLDAAKHVFVEKPMALRTDHAHELVGMAERRNLKLMVGHVLEHHPAVDAMESLVESGRLGHVTRIVSFRFAVAPTRVEGAWWSLAPHDIALARRLFREDPDFVLVRSNGGGNDSYRATLQFPSGVAEIEVQSAAPRKTRRTLVLGTAGAAEFDDCRPDAHLRLLDVEASLASTDHDAEFPGRTVDVPCGEPLQRELAAFAGAVLTGTSFRGDAESGYRVTAALEAGEASLRTGRATRVTPYAEALTSRAPLL